MDRARFGRWGAALHADDFAKAMAAAGVLAGRAAPPDELLAIVHSDRWLDAELARLVGHARETREPLRWTNPLRHPRWEELAATTTADDLAAAWQSRPVRFHIPGEEFDDDLNPEWVTGVLTTSAAGGMSVALLSDRPSRSRQPTPWEWPLRIGFLGDPHSQRLQERAAADREHVHFMAGLTTLHRLGPAPACDVVLAPMSLPKALAAVLDEPVRAAAVVLAGTLTGRWRHARPLIDALRSVTKASIVGFLGGVDPAQWLIRFVDNFAHDEPLDKAFFFALHTTAGAVLLAEERFLAEARVSRHAARMLADLEHLATAAPIPGTEPPAIEADDRAILAEAHDLTYTREIEGATEVANAERRARAGLERVEPRWLQAQVQRYLDPAMEQLSTFEPATQHAIDVRIGLEDTEWHALETAFPAHELPEHEAPHLLTVVLTEPDLLDQPLTGELLLPRIGSSQPTRFMLRTRPDTADVNARIIVAYGNRVLQTAMLRGGVVGKASDPSIRLEPETIVRVHTHDLAERRRFDAALVLNHSSDGIPRATALVDAKAAVVDLDDRDVTEASRLIRERFEEIVEAPDDFDSLDAPGMRDLLLFLATRGALLRDALAKDWLGEALTSAERLQLVAARAEAFFPIEFCYDLPAPNPDAQLCPGAMQALATRQDCGGPHDATTVCPLGFWALSKVIERHAFQPADPTRPDRGYLVRSELTTSRQRINLGSSTLFAASDRVDGFRPGTIEHLSRQLEQATGGKAASAASWVDWVQRVATDQPSVLLMLPHTTYEENLAVYGLEIGASERLWGSQIVAEYVHGGDDHAALVLLLGCATASGPITYEDFPSRFRRVGAEIFVGTIPKILGRHAAPVGELIVQLLAELTGQHEVTFGELMLEMRRRSLERGVPMALALIAYGDADWVLESTG